MIVPGCGWRPSWAFGTMQCSAGAGREDAVSSPTRANARNVPSRGLWARSLSVETLEAKTSSRSVAKVCLFYHDRQDPGGSRN